VKLDRFAKKTLALILSMALLLSALIIPGMISSAGGEEIEIWDGSVASSFAGGTGTAADPYIIKNGAQLAFAIQYNVTDNDKYNKHFALANDIYLNDITKIDWKTGEVAEGYTPTTWIHKGIKDGNSGYFHGNGHSVYGLYINEPANGASTRVGLVPLTWGGVKFYDFGMDYTYINTQGPASFFIGYGKSSSSTYSEFENCWVGENSTLISADSASGFAYGQFKYITFKNCYSVANISGAAKSAAFAGDIWGGPTMWYKNCYALSALYKNNGGSVTDCYSAAQSMEGLTQLDAADMLGSKAQVNMPLLGSAFAVTDGYPVLKVQRDADAKIWGGFMSKPADADANGEYEINTPEELAWYVKNGGSAKLTCDLYLNDLTVKVEGGTPTLKKASDGSAIDPAKNDLLEWFGTGTALGATSSLKYTFGGDGHVIYGLYHNHGDLAVGANYAGIFNIVASGTSIYGVGIEDAYMVSNASWAAALLVGRENNATYTIDSCYAGANTYHKGYDSAALVGGGGTPSTPATIKNCYVLSTIKGTHGSNYTNAFVGDNWGSTAVNFYNCYTSLSRGYRSGTVKEDLFTNVYVKEGYGKAAAMSLVALGDAFVTTEGYPTLAIFVKEPDEKVNLPLGTALFEGKGTEAEPYLVKDAEDLKYMVGTGGMGAYFELTNDIYLNDVKAVNWKNGTVNAGYVPESWFMSANESGTAYQSFVDKNDVFDGTVDGNGFAVHGIYYPLGNESTLAGLAPYANNASFLDLGIEDSFIASGRFTGGFVGYGKTVNLSGCYVDDSCAVFGWDAGAAYVNADSDIHTSGGSGLCLGSCTYTYKEDAKGTYVKSGDSYHAFTAADYEGTKYKYDEENDTYSESAEGTFLLEGETYREITVDDYTGTRYAVDDIIWSGVNFTSEALGGLVGRYITGGTIENCYVTANVKSNALYIFGKEGQGVTFKAPGTNGAGAGHLGGLWGDDWAATVSATDCFSVTKPHEASGFDATKTTITDVYTIGDGSPAGVTKIGNAQGSYGLDEMPGLDTDVWYAVLGSVDYPQFTLRGTVIGDVDENGKGAETEDLRCLRETLIKVYEYRLTDYNRDGETDICDLVKLSLAANEKAAAEEEEAKNLLADVYLSSEGSDNNAGTSDAPVKTLEKAYSLVQDDGYIQVLDTITVTELPVGDKAIHVTGGTLDMSGLSTVNFGCDVYFNDNTLIFADDSVVYANGNDLFIPENETVQGIPAAIYGGGNSAVAETYIELRSGSYKAIYGGGDTGAVLGNTCLYLSGEVNKDLDLTASGASYIYGGGNTGTVYGGTFVNVSGSVNAPLDHESHTAIARLYGGSKNGNVKGDTYVEVSENAEFSYIYGGCQKGTVDEAAYIEFRGKAMSIYGGSGTVSETNVSVYDGAWVHQVFGGCEGASMTGDTNVTIYGGYIDRRIVGGCYNNANRSGLSMNYTSEYYVTGNTTVTLYDEATYNLSGDDYGVTALSRHSTNHEAENGTLIFETSELQSKLKNKLGIHWVLGTLAPAADTQTVQ